MANAPTSWIEPPPEQPKGLGCFVKGVIVLIVLALCFVVGVYFFISHGLVASQPVQLPVEELTPEALSEVHQRIEQFQNTVPTAVAPTPAPAPQDANAPTPTPAVEPTPIGRQLVLSAAEINGLIAANKKSRGHAFVSLSGNTANIQISVPTDKIPGFPAGYVNGTFTIRTNGPTSVNALEVSKIRANGFPVPSNILSMDYRGQTILGYGLSAASPYNVSSAEVRDGNVILH
ncbi:MAG: hypothetical protein ACR2MW_03840 [Chthoniobacterales bacterium]